MPTDKYDSKTSLPKCNDQWLRLGSALSHIARHIAKHMQNCIECFLCVYCTATTNHCTMFNPILCSYTQCLRHCLPRTLCFFFFSIFMCNRQTISLPYSDTHRKRITNTHTHMLVACFPCACVCELQSSIWCDCRSNVMCRLL